MKNKKGFKHYLRFYGFVVLAYTIYVLLLSYQTGEFTLALGLSIVYLPILFVALVYLFDSIMEPFFNRLAKGKKTNEQQQYQEFFQVLTNKVNTDCDFSIEDFRRLRENDRFQKALQQAFRILHDGETPELNFTLLEKKFKKNTREHEALEVVISEVKKMMTNDGKDYQK